jgi:hypothetical protein
MTVVVPFDASPKPPTVLAPVIVFAYRRVDHLQRCVESLLANPLASSTDVSIFCDGASKPAHEAQVEAVRAYVESLSGFRTVKRVLREHNFGLARSVIEGVTSTLRSSSRVIVLEDDLVVSPHFLSYMNDGLDRYQHDERVASIHAYTYPMQSRLPETFFMRGADCWGWATWERAWTHLETDGERLLNELKRRGLTSQFDFDDSYPYTQMLKDQIAGRNSSWAIRWHASCFIDGLLTLYPGRTLVENIGNDASGTHCHLTDAFNGHPTKSPIRIEEIDVAASQQAYLAFAQYFRSIRRGRIQRSASRVKEALAKLR